MNIEKQLAKVTPINNSEGKPDLALSTALLAENRINRPIKERIIGTPMVIHAEERFRPNKLTSEELKQILSNSQAYLKTFISLQPSKKAGLEGMTEYNSAIENLTNTLKTDQKIILDYLAVSPKDPIALAVQKNLENVKIYFRQH